MKYVQLGKTDLKVSIICLGTMTYGHQNTEAEAHEQLDYALERGVNFIDTAELYPVPGKPDTQGLTERYIGTWLKKSGKREEIILASKITGPSPGLKYIRSNLGFDRNQIMQALDNNLERLRTDYLDIYQLHWPERKTNFFGKLGYDHDIDETWEDNFIQIVETMNELIKSGKIRHWGISNETPWGLMHYLSIAEKHNLARCISIQNPYNLLNRSFEIGLAEMAIREDVPLLAYSPLAFGLLSGKYHNKKDGPHDRLNLYKVMSRYNNEECWKATQAYNEIANTHGLTPTQLSLAYINTRPFLGANIIGATSMTQLKENIDSYTINLPQAAIKSIEDVHKKYSNPAP